jgi:fluoroacetyl-CoA thioesterase
MDPGEGSVGTLVNVTHTAATPPGMEVTVDVRCIGVDGRKTVWEIEARDDAEAIGKGTHERFAVDFAKFNARIAKKAAGA